MSRVRSAPSANAAGSPVETARLVAVTDSMPLGQFDPVASFRQISSDGQGFILDGRSPEPGASRYAYVGAGDCRRLLTGPGTEIGDVNPALALREQFSSMKVTETGVSESGRLLSGAVGYFGYEAIRHFEPSVADLPHDPLELPESAFFLPDKFVAYDRHEQVLAAVVLVNARADEPTKKNARTIATDLLRAGSGHPDREFGYFDQPDEVLVNTESKTHYEEMVRSARNEIERGELIQVVLSQRAVQRTHASPLDVYAALSKLNPSPYMFMLNFGEFALVGSSPELMVRSRRREVSMHPIAGTRPRGATPETDAAFEAELLTSEKERAEHVMLVDLARNDLGRVSEAGSVDVDSFMAAERYSHVMHLVSRVRGRLRPGADGLDAFVAGFPLGTLTGAPRLRSVELIAELEGEGRGPYCGGVGWFDASGDVDTGTVIRSVAMKNGEAHVQGGSGIVFDSEPEREYLESVHKMTAQFRAIEVAEKKQEAMTREGSDVAAG